jgi:putative membrane protein
MMDGYDMSAVDWTVMIVFWVLAAALVVWVAMRLTPNHAHAHAADAHESPIDILDRRLARGEIDVATYDELRSRVAA